MNPRSSPFWGRVLIGLGMLLVCGGALLAAVALVVDMPWGSLTGRAVAERTLAMAFLVVSGVLAGAPFIVLGQLVLALMEQRELMRRVADRLDSWNERVLSGGTGTARTEGLHPVEGHPSASGA